MKLKRKDKKKKHKKNSHHSKSMAVGVWIMMGILVIAGLGYATTIGTDAGIITTGGINASSVNGVLYVQAGNASDIQAKINQCGAKGCAIVIPCGTYDVNTEVTINVNNITISGNDRCSVLNVTGGGFDIVSTGDNVVFKHLAIHGNNVALNNSVRLLYFTGDKVRISNLYISNLPNITLRVDGDEVVVSDNVLDSVYQGMGVGGSAAADGFKTVSFYRNIIEAAANSFEGFDSNLGSIENAEVILEDNQIINFSNQGIDIAAGNVRVVNNIIRLPYTSAATAGIYLGASINLSGIVSGNSIYVANGTGIRLTTDNVGVTVTGNTIEGSTETIGIKVQGERHIIAGNILRNLGEGIHTYSTAGQLSSIYGNLFANNTQDVVRDSNVTIVNNAQGINNIEIVNSTSTSEPSKDGLVLYYTFNQESIDTVNGRVIDNSPNAVHANYTNTFTTVKNGFNGGQAGLFQVSRIDTGNPNRTIGNGNVTVCVWLNPQSDGGSSNVLRILDNGQLIFGLRSTNRMSLLSDGASDALTSNSAITVNTWNHVCAIRNHAGIVTFYVNGFTDTADSTSGTPGFGSTNMFIGNNGAGTRAFNGTLDDLRVYNRLLSESEVRAIFFAKKEDYMIASKYAIVLSNTTAKTCASVNEGEFYYDGSTRKHYGCNSTTWNALY